MKLKETILPIAAAAALLTSCGENHRTEAAGTTSTTVTLPEVPLAPAIDAGKAMMEELNSYRNKVIHGHRAAEILLGSCVAWGNQSGGLTVTLNPGIGRVNLGDGQEHSFFIFSTHDARYQPDWGPLNGPAVGSPDVMTLIFKPKIFPKGSIENRRVSEKEHKDVAGQRYYMDVQTKEPVMNTVLVSGSLTGERVAEVCDELRNLKPTGGSNA